MIHITGIPRPPGFFRATGTVDSTSILDGSVGAVDVANTLVHDMSAKTDPVVGDAIMIADSEASNINKKATITNISKATGEQKILTDKFTIGATPDRIVLTNNGATHTIATDIITVFAFE